MHTRKKLKKLKRNIYKNSWNSRINETPCQLKMSCKEVLMTQRPRDRLICGQIGQALENSYPASCEIPSNFNAKYSYPIHRRLRNELCLDKRLHIITFWLNPGSTSTLMFTACRPPELNLFGPDYNHPPVSNCKGLMLCDRPMTKYGENPVGDANLQRPRRLQPSSSIQLQGSHALWSPNDKIRRESCWRC